MNQIIETVQDVEKAFGLPPRSPQATVEPSSARSAGKPASEHAFPLLRSYEIKGVSFSQISLRPPRGHEFWEIGDIAEWQVVATTHPMRIENIGAIRAYAERCASLPGEAAITGAAIVEALDLRDTLALRKAVAGFFRVQDEGDSG